MQVSTVCIFFFLLKTCSNNTIRRALMISEKSVQSGAGSGYRLYMRSQKSESIFFTSKQPKFETRGVGELFSGNHLIIHTYSTYSIYKDRSFVGLSPLLGRKQQQPHGNNKANLILAIVQCLTHISSPHPCSLYVQI